jgi:hypothetical protein
MPMSKEGKKMMNSMKKTYGKKKAKKVFNAMENQGRVPGMAMGGMTKKPMGYGEGGLVKATGKMNTGIKGCGDA